MKLIVLVLVFVSCLSHASDVFKCVKDGRTSYQDAPCDKASSSTQMQTGKANAMIGCYAVEFAGFESGSSVERFEIRQSSGDEFKLDSTDGKTTQSLPMKRATPGELRDVGNAFHLDLRDGLSVRWDAGTPSQKPVGLYQGRDASGGDVIFAFFFLSNGFATKVQCP